MKSGLKPAKELPNQRAQQEREQNESENIN
jgi:hypothetical protein